MSLIDWISNEVDYFDRWIIDSELDERSLFKDNLLEISVELNFLKQNNSKYRGMRVKKIHWLSHRNRWDGMAEAEVNWQWMLRLQLSQAQQPELLVYALTVKTEQVQGGFGFVE